MDRYRSGHNEAVLKTVGQQCHQGSNPCLSALYNENRINTQTRKIRLNFFERSKER